MVRFCDGLPAVKPAEPVTFEMSGSLLMVNVTGLDGMPPEVTVMAAEPGTAISVGATVAVSRLLLTNVVGRFCPFHCTAAPNAKLLPDTVRVNPPEPAGTDRGVVPAILGPGGVI